MAFEAVHADLAVARRILAGDEAAFGELFDHAFPRLYRYALARLGGDHEAARDVVQQTFCRAVERLDAYRGEAALYTWLYQICRNALGDHFRSTGREHRHFTPLEELPQVRAVLDLLRAPAAAEPEVGAWRAEIGRLVQATVDALPERYAAVLEWKYIDGDSVKGIATRLGVTDKAAESLLTRSREAFRSALSEMASDPDVFSPPDRT
jgi:RNA polymerase sigma-70 factor (ECF subfamily)